MPVTVDGLSSGMKTDEIIEKIRKVEEEPIRQNERQIEELKLQNLALDELKKRVNRLQSSLEEMNSFRAPFEKKLIESDPAGAIEGTATKEAAPGEHEIEIINLASNLKVASSPQDSTKTLPASTVDINGKSKEFAGGTIDDFKKFLEDNYADALTAKTVTSGAGKKTLVLESKKPGASGVLDLKDSAGLLKEIGLVSDEKPPVKPDQTQPPKLESLALIFTQEKLSESSPGPANIREAGRILRLADRAARNLEAAGSIAAKWKDPAYKIQRLSLRAAEVQTRQTTQADQETDNGPFEISQGPVDNLVIKNISLDSYNITRERTPPQSEPVKERGDYGIRIATSSGVQAISLKNAAQAPDGSGTYQIPLTEIPVAIEFYTNDNEVDFSDLNLVFETTAKDPAQQANGAGKNGSKSTDATDGKNGEGTSGDTKSAQELGKEKTREQKEEQKKKFPHILTPAQNANIVVDGVPVERERNDQIKDLIDGAVLNLKKSADGPVKVRVTGNVAESAQKIELFIKEYNELLQFSQDVSATSKITEPGKFQENKNKNNIAPLVTNATVRSLINGLRIRVSNPYPAVREPNIRILDTLGISSGKAGMLEERELEGKSDKLSGLLKFTDRDRFEDLIQNHPTAVREFFSLDTNGDVTIDNGMAYTMIEFLKAYSNPSDRGLINSQIVSNKKRIEALEKDSAKKQAQVEARMQNMKQKFGHMEGVMEKQKATGDYLKQRFQSGKE